MEINQLLENGNKIFLPNLSIDFTIIGYRNEQLQCLLLRFSDKWLLPGGYLKKTESVDAAAQRILWERTHLENAHLKFLSVFGDENRSFKKEFIKYFKENKLPWRDDYWINNRFVTLAYYSLVDINRTHPKPGLFAEEVRWFPIDDLPAMWLDHEAIVAKVRERLKSDIQREYTTLNLLSKQFTMPQLHQLHQQILEEKIDRSRFQKKMLSTGLFERLPRLKKETPGRQPFQYRLKSGNNS